MDAQMPEMDRLEATARNRAAREARGEWLALLDADDLWLPEKLEHQVAYTASPDIGIVFARMAYAADTRRTRDGSSKASKGSPSPLPSIPTTSMPILRSGWPGRRWVTTRRQLTSTGTEAALYREFSLEESRKERNRRLAVIGRYYRAFWQACDGVRTLRILAEEMALSQSIAANRGYRYAALAAYMLGQLGALRSATHYRDLPMSVKPIAIPLAARLDVLAAVRAASRT